MEIKVLGFDPSTSNWGMVLTTVNLNTLQVRVEEMLLSETESEAKKGVIKQSDDLRRARAQYEEMMRMCSKASLVISEIPFMNPGSYASANFNSGLVTGVLAACPLPIIQVSPQEVKLIATGARNAAKEEMIQWGMEKHPEAPWLTRKLKGKVVPIKSNEHLADALAAVYAGLQSQQFKQATAMFASMTQKT